MTGQAEFIAKVWQQLRSRGHTHDYNASQLADALARAMHYQPTYQPVAPPPQVTHDITQASDLDMINEMLKRGFAVALMPAQELAEGLAA